MEIVFCYYDDIQHDARAQEEMECLMSIGHVSFVSYQCPKITNNDVDLHITDRRSYLSFLIKSKKVIKNIRPDIVFFHDYYCAILIPFVKRLLPKCKIVYDMSELYIGGHEEKKHEFLNRLFLYNPEYNNLRLCDLILSANIERAYIAKGYFALNQLPVVFDNNHYIDSQFYDKNVEKKHEKLFRDGKFTVIYSGGLRHPKERDIIGLLQSFSQLDQNKYQLLICGSIDNSDKTLMHCFQLAKQKNASISYLGLLNRDELKYLYSNSDVNVVIFNQKDINTIFCASGKFYEGLYEGLPLIVSDNPPLVSACNTYHIGKVVKDGDYCKAIKELETHLEEYKFNVSQYVKTLDYKHRIVELKDTIEKIIT